MQYPADYNFLTNSSVYMSDAIYMMGKSPSTDNYTMCELRSWMSPECSSRFDVSGRSGATMKAECEDDASSEVYRNSWPEGAEWSPPSMDWKVCTTIFRVNSSNPCETDSVHSGWRKSGGCRCSLTEARATKTPQTLAS